MASLNLHEVTAALARLIELNVARLMGTNGVTVTYLTPEKADEQATESSLNLHLYHVAHDADGGNDLPLRPAGRNPIATRPLPLKLYYVLTPHSLNEDSDADTAGRQMLMGLAMKTLHDIPVIDDQLALDGSPLLPAVGERRVEIILRPVSPEEAVNFWSADQMRTARLAAYYEVRTILLEAEPATSATGVVAALALDVRPEARPTLGATESLVRFSMPAALGHADVSLRRRPAVVPLRLVGSAGDTTRLNASGNALGDGGDALVVLRGEQLHGRGLPGNAAVLDPLANPDWEIVVSDASLSLAVRPSAQAQVGGGLQHVPLVPGVYTVALRRARRARTETGLERPLEAESNRTVFALAPFVASATLGANDHVLIRVDAALDVADPAAETQLSIGGDLYRRVAAFAGDASDAGAFITRDGDTYEAAPSFDATLPGRSYPVRVNVNGVDSQPFWLELP